MRFTEEHEQFRKSVRAVIESEINPYVDEWEAAGAVGIRPSEREPEPQEKKTFLQSFGIDKEAEVGPGCMMAAV